MNEKRYYWLKLKENFFEEDTISWLEEQENGKEYCLFYLKLCLKSLKTDGVLIRNVGELLIPYDVKKLGEMTNTDIDTVRIAMELFKQIGLVQILDNGEIYITQLSAMVGSETKWATYKRKSKLENLQQLSNNFPIEIEIEKDKEIDKEIDMLQSNKPVTKSNRFKKPTLEEVKAYCKERNNQVDAERFIDFYESKGWKVGNQSMKDWKACVRTWENKENKGWKNKIEPSWMDKEVDKEKATDEEEQEIIDLLSEFK